MCSMSRRGSAVRHTMRSKRHHATLAPVHQLRGYTGASVQCVRRVDPRD